MATEQTGTNAFVIRIPFKIDSNMIISHEDDKEDDDVTAISPDTVIDITIQNNFTEHFASNHQIEFEESIDQFEKPELIDSHNTVLDIDTAASAFIRDYHDDFDNTNNLIRSPKISEKINGSKLLLPFNGLLRSSSQIHAIKSFEIMPSIESPVVSILVVDDAPMNVKMLCRLLAFHNFSLVTAEDGAVAVEKMRARMQASEPPFSLVLMDYQMPVMVCGRSCMNANSCMVYLIAPCVCIHILFVVYICTILYVCTSTDGLVIALRSVRCLHPSE